MHEAAAGAIRRKRGAKPARQRFGRILGLAGIVGAAVLAGCGSSSSTPVLTWYINPDNGGQKKLADKCTKAAHGRYRIETSALPSQSTSQREQLVRRLAANDSGIDIISLDIPYLAEFANAGFIRKYTPAEQQKLTAGMLQGPLKSATWKGSIYGVPFNSNTQLLWVHRSVAQRAGLGDVTNKQLTWDQVIDAAVKTHTTVQVQAMRYEGYTVLINSLIAGAGGQILKNPEAGKNVTPSIDSPAGEKAAAIISKLAHSSAASPGISNADEGATQAGFLLPNGGFMTNWPFVYTAAQGTPALKDFTWSRFPATVAGRPSAPPLGGINLAVGAFSPHPADAVDAIGCITSKQSQKEYMLGEGLLPTYASVYDDPAIKKAFPMADLLRTSVAQAAPRPLTPYYEDITSAIQRTWHPPNAVTSKTPGASAALIVSVLQDKQLL